MSYIDCYLIPVPRANKAAYEQIARMLLDDMAAVFNGQRLVAGGFRPMLDWSASG